MLGYHEFLDGLTRGIAAHHAGMLPTFKECVEELFLRGLCRVVFATETLALGINMPARSVVIEKLSKWNGETHADITPGEYTQLTGRAGRRGIDVEGHGVVLWQQGFDPKAVAGLASTRTYPLKSSFRPSYNMAVNLVHQFGRDAARELLESSFAQFQADKAVVGLARQLRKSEDALEGYAEAARLRQGRLHGVRRPAAPALRHREEPRQVAPVRPPPGRDRLPGVAAPRRRDRGARRPVRRHGRRHRPRHPGRPGRPASLRAHRRPARASAQPRRLPDPGRLDHAAEDPEELQRPQPAVAPRPRLDAAQPHAQPDAPTARRSARQGSGQDAGGGPPDRGAAQAAARAPVPRLPRPRGPRPLVRALLQARPGREDAEAPHRAAHQHDRPAVRPGLRRAHRAGLPRGRGRAPPRSPTAAAR